VIRAGVPERVGEPYQQERAIADTRNADQEKEEWLAGLVVGKEHDGERGFRARSGER
jgi:hypothetical protein